MSYHRHPRQPPRYFTALTALLIATQSIAAEDSQRPRSPGTAQSVPGVAIGPDNLPSPAIMPHEDDYSYFADQAARRDVFDRLKYVPLSDNAYASFGANLRYRYEFYDEFAWGTPPGQSPFQGTRATVFGSVTFDERFRLFGAVKHGDFLNGDANQNPAEVDSIDLHMAFGEVVIGDAFGLDPKDMLVRVGRQELHYGNGRFISIRNGPNVRDDYDGVLLRTRLPDGSVTDALAFFEVEDNFGGFDNGTDENQGFWGIYHTRPAGKLAGKPLFLDLYYFGYQFDDEIFVTAAPGNEFRHTFAVRPWIGGPPIGPGFSGDLEAFLQFGELEQDGEDLDTLAWAFTGSARYGFDMPWSPALAGRFGVTSGDQDDADGTLNTFRAAHPPGRFFGETNPLGPGNLFGFTTALELNPTEKLTLAPSALFFWRFSDEDGIYNPPGFPVRGAAGDDRFIGWEFNLIGKYKIDSRTTLSLEGGYFFAGGYLEDNPPSSDIIYAAGEINIKL